MRVDSRKNQSTLSSKGLFFIFLSFIVTTSVAFHSSTLPSHFSTRISSSPSLILAPPQQHRTLKSSSTKLNTWNNDEINGPDRIKSCIPYMVRNLYYMASYRQCTTHNTNRSNINWTSSVAPLFTWKNICCLNHWTVLKYLLLLHSYLSLMETCMDNTFINVFRH